MNYSRIFDKVVTDTNILYMAWYNPNGKCADSDFKNSEKRVDIDELLKIVKEK